MRDDCYIFNFLFVGVIAGAFLITVVGSAIIVNHDAEWKKDAVKRGYAEYYLDENNDRQWRWKEGK